jgi:pimeloyl-ACP methyl ester carboxylesterase
VRVQPPVIFFPGATGAGDFWSPVAALLPRGWETRLLSWPGAGGVPSAPEINGYNDLVELAAAAVPDGGDVVAQSMGGVVAIGLALARPRRLRRLVLVATSGGLDVGALYGEDWRDQYRAEFPQAAPWVTADSVDYSERLAELDLPVCLIWGYADPISPPAVGRALHARLSASVLHVLSGGTHALARERPGEVAALIEQHLTATPES